MKRIGILLGIMLVGVMVVWGGGKKETSPTDSTINIRETSGDTKVMSFRYATANNFGNPVVDIEAPDVEYACLKLDGKIFNAYTGVELEGDDYSSYFGKSGSAGYAFSNSSAGKIQFSGYNQFQMPPDPVRLGRLKGTGPIRIVWESSPTNLHGELVLIAEDGSTCSWLEFSIDTEFFPGERQLFSRVSGGYTYEQKAYALLSEIFDGEDNNNFKNAIQNRLTEGNGAYWNMFSDAGITIPEETRTSLKIALGNQFDVRFREENGIHYPYIHFGESDFAAVYGANRNPYVKAYLYYCYSQSKPLLSWVFTQELQREKAIPYDYRQYERFDAQGESSEGRQLARAALKYLSWGLEYTPFQTYQQQNMIPANTRSMVYQDNLETIRQWIGEDDTNEPLARESNYYPGYTDDADHQIPHQTLHNPLISTIHTVQGTFTGSSITLAAPMQSGKTMGIRKVDFWTGRNVLNDQEVIQQLLVNGSPITGSLLHDRSFSSSVDEVRSLTIRFNCSFSADALLLAARGTAVGDERGSATVETPVFPLTKKIPGTWYQSDQAEGCWRRLHPAPTGSSASEAPIEYYCFVFDSTQTGVTELTFRIDHLNLDVAEIMVFEGNPIEYITDCGAEQVSLEGMLQSPGPGQSPAGEVMKQVWFNTSPASVAHRGAARVTIADLAFRNPSSLNSRPWVRLFAEGEVIELWDRYSDQFLRVRDCRGTEGGITDNASYYSQPGKMLFSVHFKRDYVFKTITLWESGSESALADGITTMIDAGPVWLNAYLEMEPAGYPGDLERLPALTTPFAGRKRGNPLPYAAGGLDSPRTFAYKMHRQVQAKEWYQTVAARPAEKERMSYTATTRALDRWGRENYQEAYLREMDVIHRDSLVRVSLSPDTLIYQWAGYYTWQPDTYQGCPVQPFLPGLRAPNGAGWVDAAASPYSREKIAGVDSMGLLMNSLAMSGAFDRVVNALNEKVAENLDRYNRFTPGEAGISASKGLVYYAGKEGVSFLSGKYTFTWYDLERSTVLVPDLSLIQPGDLLLAYDTKAALKVGVVVGTGWTAEEAPAYGSDARLAYGRVYVVTVDQGLQCVTLGRWGNGAAVFGGFSTEPQRFQIRRLVKLKAGGGDFLPGIKDGWEVLDKALQSLEVRFVQKNRSVPRLEHYLPNTGTIYYLGQIELKGKDGLGERAIGPEESEVVLLSPEDPYFSEQPDDYADAAASNVYRNQGGGLEFYALDTRGTERRIATLTRKTGIDENDECDSYTVSYNPEYFEAGESGKCLTGYRFGLEAGRVVFRTTDAYRGKGFYLDEFGLKAIAAGGRSVRPGDDFRLRFALRGNKTLVATARPEDALAVYDHKLLWRANLYIQESGEDWNDAHPWDDPVNNKWFISQTSGAVVDGGQVPIKPWTRWNDNRTVVDAVAYSLGGADSVADFTADLEEQKDAIRYYYSTDNPLWTPANPNPHPEWANWNKTTAPGGAWSNYLPPLLNLPENYQVQNTDGKMPYRPSYASAQAYEWFDVRYSAGLDCNGFVERVSNYVGNIYRLHEPQNGTGVPEVRQTWTNWPHAKHTIDTILQNSDVIWVDRPVLPPNQPAAEDEIPVKSIKPGDIIICITEDVPEGAGFPVPTESYNPYDHVMIVSEIDFGDERLVRGDIKIVESAVSLKTDYKVINNMNLWNYRDEASFRNWTFVVCRLRSR